ncbi:MAG: thiamine-phosphate kinase [PS1 clade bacterium]|nr:thiamine-phosphate kinase [PS1 clade bacterium]
MTDDTQLDEFGLIAELLAPLADNNAAARLSDDAAQVTVPDGQALVISTDMLVANVHFPANADAALVANRLMACNISDLAAKGAQPYGCLLTLGVAENWDSAFLTRFVATLADGLKTYEMQLWGGDTVRAKQGFAGLTVHGLVPHGEMVTRSGAQDGDDVYVTGTIGDGFLDLPDLGSAYAAPAPPIAFGQAVRGLVNAAIDVSDGLMADLDHICRASKGGIEIEAEAIPLSEAGRAYGDLAALVCGGDDLQMAFTAPPAHADILGIEAEKHRIALTRIGRFSADGAHAAILRSEKGTEIKLQKRGFRHF